MIAAAGPSRPSLQTRVRGRRVIADGRSRGPFSPLGCLCKQGIGGRGLGFSTPVCTDGGMPWVLAFWVLAPELRCWLTHQGTWPHVNPDLDD